MTKRGQYVSAILVTLGLWISFQIWLAITSWLVADKIPLGTLMESSALGIMVASMLMTLAIITTGRK